MLTSTAQLSQAEADVAEAVNVIGELKRRLKEQAHEMAAYKVDAENKAGKVQAAISQLHAMSVGLQSWIAAFSAQS